MGKMGDSCRILVQKPQAKGRTCSDITVDEKEDYVWSGFRCFRIGAESLQNC